MVTTTTTCGFCNKKISCKTPFGGKYANHSLNVKIAPHVFKCHRKELTYKRVLGLIHSILYLIIFTPILIVLLLFMAILTGTENIIESLIEMFS